MQLAQKISVSIDPGAFAFLESYLAKKSRKSRSSVVNEALHVLEQRERERALESAYAQSAPTDLHMVREFDASLNDGLADEAW